MLAVINEKQITEEQAEQLQLEELVPEKFNPEIQFKVNKEHSNVQKEVRYRTLTREETAALIAASNAPFEPPPPQPMQDYPTYTREQVEALVCEHFEYKENEKKKREEYAKWDSQKTTVSGIKTGTSTKRSKSTKA